MIIHHYGCEPIQVRKNTALGELLFSSVGRRSETNIINIKSTYEESIEMILPSHLLRYSWNRVRLSSINKFYRDTFKRELFIWIEAQTQAGFTIKESIECFFSRYQIKEEEYTPDTARREYNRYLVRERQKRRKVST